MRSRPSMTMMNKKGCIHLYEVRNVDLSILLRPGVPAGLGPEGLPLEPGRLLAARVQSVGEDGVRLRLFGRTVAARSLVPLRAGDLLRLRVEGAEGGVLRLRLLAPVPAPAGLDDLLRGFGLPPGPKAETAARALALARLPLTDANLRAVLSALRGRPEPRLTTAYAAALLLSRGLPARGEALAAVQAHLEGPPPFASVAAELARLVRGGGAAGPAPGGGAPAGSPGAGALERVLRALTLSADPGPGASPAGTLPEAPAVESAPAARLRAAVAALGLDHEHRVFGPLLAEGPGPAGGSPPGAPPETLKGVLLALSRSGEAGPAPAVEAGLEALTAWQALSAAPADPGAGGRLLVFHLPVAFGAGMRTLEVAVEKPSRRPRGEAGAGNADAGEAPLTVHLRLEPPHLGELRVRLVLAARRVGIALAAREAETVRTLEAGREALERRLEACGFALDGVDVRSLPPREEEAAARAPITATAPRGIDLVL